MSLSTRILLGLVLGFAVGLFFGEYVAFLGVVGDGFVMLLQMTVLPYVTVSLAHGLGSVSGAEASKLAKRAGGFLVLLWALSLGAVFLSPLALPDWESASFFSTNLLETREGFDFLGLFIPANIFRSLADAVVPAIVLFSLAVGAALIGIPQEQKRGLLQGLATLSEVFSRITGIVVRLAPYGVFAITAHAGGTLSVEEAEGLQFFAALYIALALALTFWTLPVLVTTLTPFSYREVVWSTRDALVTSFATGNMFVVLAMLRLYLPQAEIVVLESPREFLRGQREELDAMLFPAESAGAWSLVYPSFSVAIPQPDVVSAPLAYPVARGDLQMAAFLSNWIELKKKDGTIKDLHEHWILGGATRQRGPRWSVIRDVLGWVK